MSSFLAEIFSSRTRAEFLRIFFGLDAKNIHLREIQRQAGLAIGSIRQEAQKLEKMGLIRKKVDGNRTYYQANTEHPLYTTLRELVLKTSGIPALLNKALSTDKVDFAFIFGSIAAGSETAKSDIDLFVIGEIGLRELSKLLKQPGSQTNREINPHVMTKSEFATRKMNKEHFVTTVLAAPVIMVKGEKDDFTKLGE